MKKKERLNICNSVSVHFSNKEQIKEFHWIYQWHSDSMAEECWKKMEFLMGKINSSKVIEA